ncbi:Mu transposase C-terminal domain-containing protein [Mesorhizobium kowhaii]|uniref:Mu transposase C-terminal domain-containing protein n=1 Tax=Mesorhizobium kowhaii TaxID=1300272 RepID=UPI0035E9BD61
MNVFNGNAFRSSAPTTYGFEPGHVFAIREGFDEVLYKHISHDRHVLTASPLANPELRQVFPQDEIRELVEGGRLDPLTERNSGSRQTLLARSPDIRSARDLDQEEQDQLAFYWKLCRHVVQMYDDGLTSLTDKALKRTIGKVMAHLVYGADDDSDDGRQSKRGKREAAGMREISARKAKGAYRAPSPATVRKWIRDLVQHEWDLLALRDHRKGRVGGRTPKITDPHAVALMAKWVQAFLDRSRPSAATLYRLMTGSTKLEEENARRDREGAPRLRGTEALSFAATNLARSAQGLPALPVPSLSTFERAIRKLDSYQVALARYGAGHARRTHKVSGRPESVLYPGERVALDCWRVQLMSLKLPEQFWEGIPEELVGKIVKLRLMLCVAIDEATKVVLGAKLSWSANADTSIRTLEMVCRNKDEIALAAGCRSTWRHACSPLMVATDSGSEFIDAGFRCAVTDIGSANEIGPASHPDARGVVERFFETVDSQLLPFFQGRTFSSVGDKGEANPEALAHVVSAVLGPALVRYIVDVYHNSPHAGLGGQTPNEAWEERAALFKVVPPPAKEVITIAFGFSDNRRIQNRGVRFLGLYYRSEALSQLRRQVGQADIRMRADLENLGTIWVSKNVPGAEWFAVHCDMPMEGVSAALWEEAAAALRRKHADIAKLSDHIVQAALLDLRETGRHSASVAGIGPSTVSREEVLRREAEIERHFNYTTVRDRGQTFEDLDANDQQTDNLPPAADDSQVPETLSEDEDADSHAPIARRRGRLKSDFLRKD